MLFAVRTLPFQDALRHQVVVLPLLVEIVLEPHQVRGSASVALGLLDDGLDSGLFIFAEDLRNDFFPRFKAGGDDILLGGEIFVLHEGFHSSGRKGNIVAVNNFTRSHVRRLLDIGEKRVSRARTKWLAFRHI